MKSLLILSVLLCVTVSIRAAAVVPVEAAALQQEDSPLPESVVPVEAAAVQQEDSPVPESDVNGETAVAAGRAASSRQVRFSACLEDWHSYRGNCYYLVNHPDSWRNAESFCAGYGGSLASVHNIWEYNKLQTLVKTAGHTYAWIGGYYFQGDWKWEDGSLYDYNNWDSEASTDLFPCLVLNSQVSKGWSNHDCSMSFPFVCQVNPNC